MGARKAPDPKGVRCHSELGIVIFLTRPDLSGSVRRLSGGPHAAITPPKA